MTTAPNCTRHNCNNNAISHGLCLPHLQEAIEQYKLRNGTCTVGKCEQPIEVKGRCKRHYNAWHAHQRSHHACSVNRCGRNATHKSMCSKHYARDRRLGDVNLPARPNCNIDNCDDDATRKGKCNKHYMQDYRASRR